MFINVIAGNRKEWNEVVHLGDRIWGWSQFQYSLLENMIFQVQHNILYGDS